MKKISNEELAKEVLLKREIATEQEERVRILKEMEVENERIRKCKNYLKSESFVYKMIKSTNKIIGDFKRKRQ